MDVSASPENQVSHKKILKATSITGSASVIGIIFGIIRVKVLAVLIGPAGIGVIGLCHSVIEMGTTIAGMGLRTSGVREIANDRENPEQTGLVISTMFWIALVTGFTGGLAMFLFSEAIATFTFGEPGYSSLVELLGLAVFAGVLTRHYSATVQGMQRIADLARLMIIGALAGTVIGIPIIFFFGIDGVGPMIVTVAAASLISSWWYSRKLRLPNVYAGWSDYGGIARRLLSQGVILMFTALATVGAAYIIRVLVKNMLSLEAVGLFTAAYTLSSLYVGFILQAMGADFFPRLSSMSDSHGDMVLYVNRQLEMSVLLAASGVVATIAYSDIVISLFYDTEFRPASDLLQWQVLGVFGRVVSWPMSFILLAKASKGPYLFAEISANVLYIALAYAGLKLFGLVGVGMAFVAMYVYYTVLIRLFTGRLVGFRFSSANIRLVMSMLMAVGGVFLLTKFLGGIPGVSVSTVIVLIVAAASLRSLDMKLDGLLRLKFKKLLLLGKR